MTDREPVTAEAEALDRVIDQVLRGERPDDARLVEHLAAVFETPLPAGLEERVRSRVRTASRRAGVALRLLAAVLGGLFVFQGAPTAFASERLAEFLGFAHEPHVYFEAGVAFLVIGVALLAGAARSRWLDGAVAVGVPVAVVFGVFGIFELPHSPNPGAEILHFVQGSVALALGVAWIRRRA